MPTAALRKTGFVFVGSLTCLRTCRHVVPSSPTRSTSSGRQAARGFPRMMQIVHCSRISCRADLANRPWPASFEAVEAKAFLRAGLGTLRVGKATDWSCSERIAPLARSALGRPWDMSREVGRQKIRRRVLREGRCPEGGCGEAVAGRGRGMSSQGVRGNGSWKAREALRSKNCLSM